MKKYFIFLFASTLFLTMNTALDAASVYEIFINKQDSISGSKCQAVRLNDTWFLTAAHCVLPSCESKCEVRTTLISNNMFEIALETKHNSLGKKAVYTHPKAKENNSSYDIALINFEDNNSNFIYKDTSYTYTREQFLKIYTSQADIALEKAQKFTNPPTILLIKNSPNLTLPKILKRNLIVDSIWGADVSSLHSRDTVFYSPKNKFIYTRNFGIKQGISGSGVFTDKNELVAVVSSVTNTERTILSENKTEQVNFSVFSTFDEETENFLRKVPYLSFKNAYYTDFLPVDEANIFITNAMENQ